jgi:hypothetical protein
MAKIKWYRIKWRGFSGRIHPFPQKVAWIDDWWHYKEDGEWRGISRAMGGNVVKSTEVK